MILKKFIERDIFSSDKDKKGYLNEKQTSYLLDSALRDSQNYIVMHDVKINAGVGTSQIDHLIISKTGLFVIEDKFVSGDVHFDKFNNYSINYGNKEITAESPLMQNSRHVIAIEQLIHSTLPARFKNLLTYDIQNIILFSSSTKIFDQTDKKNIFKAGDFTTWLLGRKPSLKLINSFLTTSEMNLLAQKILESCILESIEPIPEYSLDYLKSIRLSLSKSESVKPFMIFSDRILSELLSLKPTTEKDFLSISGIGQVKCDKYFNSFKYKGGENV